MSSASGWIGNLVEQCLSSYLHGTRVSEFRWTDDGTSLRFTEYVRPETNQAIAVDWAKEGQLPQATVTDAGNQVVAALSKESLGKHLSEISGRQSGIRQCPINLLDFEIVLQYVAPAPDIHFHVRRFSLEPSQKKRSGPQVKKLKNDPRIAYLMQAVSKRAREHQKAPGAAAVAQGGQSAPLEDPRIGINVSQSSSPNGLLDPGISQANFASQVPIIRHSTAPNRDTSAECGRRSQEYQLLSHLERRPSEIRRGGSTPTSRVEQQDASNIDNGQADAGSQDEQRGSWQLHNQIPANGNLIVSATQEDTGLTDATGSGIHDIKDLETVTSLHRKNYDVEENAPQVIATSKQIKSNNMNSVADRADPDPWIGMTRIRPRDIKIPDDQQHLLESNRRCWVPPVPVMDMPRGHVPPSLLQSWNRIALRRTRPSPREKPSEAGSGTPPVQASPPRDALAPSQGDSDDESQYSWSPSPEKRNSRNELPADSSPIRKPPRQKESEGHTIQETLQNEQSQQGEDEKASSTNDNALHSQAGANVIMGEISQQRAENDGSGTVEVEKPDTQDFDNQSDNVGDDSSDSESDPPMDTSVPCALGASSQLAQFPSQSEPEATSSGLSLSVLSGQGQIQVLETPAADVSRLRVGLAANNSNDRDEWGVVSQQRSPQVAKSSSQPRIFNTYGSIGSDEKSQLSQEISHPSEAVSGASLGVEAGPNVDVMGTQVSNGHWSSQRRSPHSQSALVLNSSERGRRQRSASVSAPASQPLPSQLFAAYREPPLSQSDCDGHDLVDPSPSREVHVSNGANDAQVTTLKRAAREVDNAFLSPSKRLKSTCGQMDEVSAMRFETPKSLTASRRQSYVHGSLRRADALRIHEKFRSDYPNYSGDFSHFTQLCSKLRTLRTEEKLKRSFLCDDFIIMHLQQYFPYLEECAAADAKALKYEDYFTSSFFAPFYKKRSLTASAIDLCAEQSLPSREPSRTARSSVVRGESNSSFTTDLVNKLSNFHAHSVGPSPRSTYPGVGVDRQSLPAPSPTPIKRRDGLTAVADTIGCVSPAVPTPTPKENNSTADPECDIDAGSNSIAISTQNPSKSATTPVPKRDTTLDRTSNAVPSPAPKEPVSTMVPEPSADVERISNSAQIRTPNKVVSTIVPHQGTGTNRVPVVAPPLAPNPDPSISAAAPNPEPTESMRHPSIEAVWPERKRERVSESYTSDNENGHGEDSMDEDMDEDMDIKMQSGETHETANIELGNERPPPVAAPTSTAQPPDAAPTSYEVPETEPESEVESEEPSQPEIINENWFLSLRHIRPTESVWSDDPNTPFKTWARLDQNLLCERRRRGGRYLVVDEHGVVQRRLTSRSQ